MNRCTFLLKFDVRGNCYGQKCSFRKRCRNFWRRELNLPSHFRPQKIRRTRQSQGETDSTFSIDVYRVKKISNLESVCKSYSHLTEGTLSQLVFMSIVKLTLVTYDPSLMTLGKIVKRIFYPSPFRTHASLRWLGSYAREGPSRVQFPRKAHSKNSLKNR